MKTLIGKIAVWVSDNILDTVILWSAGFKRSGKTNGFRQAPFIWPVKRDIAVESAEDQLKRAPLGLNFIVPACIFLFSAATVITYLIGVWVCFLVAALFGFILELTRKSK